MGIILSLKYTLLKAIWTEICFWTPFSSLKEVFKALNMPIWVSDLVVSHDLMERLQLAPSIIRFIIISSFFGFICDDILVRM